MKLEIPQIIHQIWLETENPFPEYFRVLVDTWKKQYPEWTYEFWDKERINEFIQTHYPQYWNIFLQFPYSVQRCDAICYLILDKIGGMYVDLDYESLEPIDELIKDKVCCFAQEPQSHCELFNKRVMFNNALMLNIPGHFFMKKIISEIFTEENACYQEDSKFTTVLSTTGPWKLIDIYEKSTEKEKEQVYLIPDKFVTPFDVIQIQDVKANVENEELEKYLQDAYAVHYFWGSWVKE